MTELANITNHSPVDLNYLRVNLERAHEMTFITKQKLNMDYSASFYSLPHDTYDLMRLEETSNLDGLQATPSEQTPNSRHTREGLLKFIKTL